MSPLTARHRAERVATALVLTVIFCAAPAVASLARPAGEPPVVTSPVIEPPTPALSRCSVEVQPAMELLAGALAQTEWIEQRGPNGDGNEYYRALKAFLSPYRDHAAIRLLERLTRRGFVYELPPAFICHLGPLPALGLKCEYGDDLIAVAGGRNTLEELRLALRDLAAVSHFDTFIERWRSSYDDWVAQASNFPGDPAVSWLEGFFGTAAVEYHVILAPAMFPSGGYAASVALPGGMKAVFAVIREPGRSTFAPEIATGPQLMSLVLHEWGHSFVNPLLDSQHKRVAGLRTLYWRTMRAMVRQGYGSLEAFLDEQVLRAATSLAAGDLLGPGALAEEANYHETYGFYLTRPIIELLREYQAERPRYPALGAFMPRLLDGLTPFRIVIPPLAVVGVAGLIAVLGWLKLRSMLAEYADRRRRRLKRQPWIWK